MDRTDQDPGCAGWQLQLDALAASGYDELVTKKESGKRGVARPAWEALLALPQAGDTLKFWKSDRWGRSAGHPDHGQRAARPRHHRGVADGEL